MNMMENRIPPHDIEAEQAVLGTIILKPAVLLDVMAELTPKSFYSNVHLIIYTAILDLFNAGVGVDLITLSDRLRDDGKLVDAGGVVTLANLTGVVPVAANIMSYISIINGLAVKRDVIAKYSAIVEMAYSGIQSDELVDQVNDASLSLKGKNSSEAVGVDVLAPLVVADMIERKNDENHVVGISTGIHNLDHRLNGLCNSNYIVIAGRPGMGKTNLALKFASTAIKEGNTVLFFSMELKDKRLTRRLISMESGIPEGRIRSGAVNAVEISSVGQVAEKVSQHKLIIDDSSALTISELTAKAKREALKGGVDMIIIDYIQLMKSKRGSENRVAAMSEISAGLLSLAKDLDVPVIVLSQLNRGCESRPDKRPLPSDLKESGAIEQDADIILLLYREEFYNQNCLHEDIGVAEINIGKGRDVGQWVVKAGFDGQKHKFYNL